MEKLRAACVLVYSVAKEVMFLQKIQPKFNNKIKETRLSQFLHYCS